MSKRVVTSAIEGMTVSRVRRGLDATRKQWRERTNERPFFICHIAVEHMSMQHFAFKFVMGHHYKRHSKSKHVRDDGDDVEGEQDHQEEEEAVVEPRARPSKRSKKQV